MTITITFTDGSNQILTNVFIYYVRLLTVKIQTADAWYTYDLNDIRYLLMERA